MLVKGFRKILPEDGKQTHQLQLNHFGAVEIQEHISILKFHHFCWIPTPKRSPTIQPQQVKTSATVQSQTSPNPSLHQASSDSAPSDSASARSARLSAMIIEAITSVQKRDRFLTVPSRKDGSSGTPGTT